MPPPSPHGTAVAVLGAGSWGTALAILIARNGFNVKLWDWHPAHLRRITKDGSNQQYMPGIPLPDGIACESNLQAVVECTDQFLLVVPSHAFRTTLTNLAAVRRTSRPLIISWGTKGFDPERTVLLSDVAQQILPQAALAVISGPTFAGEVARNLPTALTVAANDDDTAHVVAAWLRSDRVRVYTNDDIAGVQLGGAIKNVMALAAGISDGIGFGANARAALITRGLAEMNRLGVALGGNLKTFMGLTGVGDLVLTCTDDQSRNRRAGIGLGQGKTVSQVAREIGQEVEGLKTVHELYAMAQRAQVEMPITEQVYKVVYEGLPAKEAVVSLLSREPKAE